MRTAPLVTIALGAAGLLGSCRGGSTAAEPRASGCSTPEASVSASSLVSASAPSPPSPHVPFAIERTCASDIDTTAAPSAQLDEIGARCAAGMIASTSNETESEGTFDIVVGDNVCVRVAAVAKSRDAVTELWLETDRGERVAHVDPTRGRAVLGPRGPVCVRHGGTFRVGVRTWGSDRSAHVRVWEAAPQPPAPSTSR